MVYKRKVVSIIPAKSWSRELPGKNVIPFCNKPLFCWTIEASIKTHAIDKTILMTDSNFYKDIVSNYRINIVKEPPLKNREGEHVIYALLEVIKDYEHFNEDDVIVLLQPTSPLRNANHISEALDLFLRGDDSNIISVTDSPKLESIRMLEDGCLSPITEGNPNIIRQSVSDKYLVNGAIYISSVSKLRENRTFHTEDAVPYYMKPQYSIDINNQNDLLLAKAIKRYLAESRR
ncbi:MAG: cytidylyltransferase domain-containing protein [Thermoplasmatota archaeon]